MSQTKLDHHNRLAALRLARTPRLGPVTYLKLLNRYTSPSAALEALPELVRAKRLKGFDIPGEGQALSELEYLAETGVTLFLLGDAAYPHALSLIPDPPIALIAHGRTELLARLACGMVGSRNASAAGRRLARDLARELSENDICVISGLARGIDGAAHEGALPAGTIAAVAGGVDIIYPPEHRKLHEQIADEGLIVSEMPMGTRPVARDFPRRNRIISGLSLGTLVIEAALQSGSLITARLAGEQGREVMALPGSPLDPRARGTNRLLRDGAHLVETAEDVLAILHGSSLRPSCVREADTTELFPLDQDFPDENARGTEAHKTVSVAAASSLATARDDRSISDQPDSAGPAALEDLLSFTPISIDELARQSDQPLGRIQADLLELELEGRVAMTAGGLVQKTDAS